MAAPDNNDLGRVLHEGGPIAKEVAVIARETHVVMRATVGLFLVIIVLTVLGFFRLQSDANNLKRESGRNDERFCSITEKFISATILLQSAQGKQTLQTIGLRQDRIRANRRMLAVLVKSAPGLLLPGLVDYLQADQALDRSVISTSQDVQQARANAQVEIRKLRQELRCAD